jgi:hypothetical protein
MTNDDKKQEALNKAITEMGKLIIKTLNDHAETSLSLKELAKISGKEKGTSDPKNVVMAIAPLAFVSVVAATPGSNEMRSMLLKQLAGAAMEKVNRLSDES